MRWCLASTAVLNVVAHGARASAAGRHRACVGVGQRDLSILGRLHLFTNRLQCLQLDLGDLVLEVGDPARQHSGCITVVAIELDQVALDAVLELLDAGSQLAGEVLVAVVHRFELAAIGDDAIGEQLQPAGPNSRRPCGSPRRCRVRKSAMA